MLGRDRPQSSAMTSIKQPSFRIEEDEDLVKEQERKGLSQLDRPLPLGDWDAQYGGGAAASTRAGHFTLAAVPGKLRAEASLNLTPKLTRGRRASEQA